MPSKAITNPQDAESAGGGSGEETRLVTNGDSVVLPVGTLVEIVIPFTGQSEFTGIQVKRSATTADNLLLGVVTGGPSPGASIAVGGIGMVTVDGFTQVLMDGATTAGHFIKQSTATAGDGTDSSTATLGQTIGEVLQTIASAGLAWAHIHKI
jgi:hypothetical protein